MRETQKSISEWATKTFGTPDNLITIYNRFVEETNELDHLINDTEYLGNHQRLEITDECADCLIVLYQVAETLGIDLHQAVDEKMSINRKRKWKITGQGVGQHE